MWMFQMKKKAISVIIFVIILPIVGMMISYIYPSLKAKELCDRANLGQSYSESVFGKRPLPPVELGDGDLYYSYIFPRLFEHMSECRVFVDRKTSFTKRCYLKNRLGLV